MEYNWGSLIEKNRGINQKPEVPQEEKPKTEMDELAEKYLSLQERMGILKDGIESNGNRWTQKDGEIMQNLENEMKDVQAKMDKLSNNARFN